MKDTLLTNRKLAWAVTALLIFVAVIFLGGRSLNQLKSGLADIYRNGVPNEGTTASAIVDSMRGQGANLSIVLSKYDIPHKKELQELSTSAGIGVVDGSKSTYEHKIRGSKETYSYINFFYENKDAYGLSEKDDEYVVSIWAEAQSLAYFAKSTGYNAEAERIAMDFNKFPANIISAVRGIQIEYLIYE